MPFGKAIGNFLLDTAVILWTVLAPQHLSNTAREIIEEKQTLLSAVSYWEIVIKAKNGRLEITDPISWWHRIKILFGSRIFSISPSHISALARLPDLHRDPFDRMLIAQAVAEGLPILSRDRQIAAYPVRTIWKRKIKP